MDKNEVFQILNTVESLPTLPIVAQQVLKLIASPISSMKQIALVITKDQAIAARVIKLTNSAFYGLRNRIGSIQQAIVILGLNTVKNLVLGCAIVNTFSENARITIFDRELFWMHAFSTALGSKHIAKYLNMGNEEDYFLAGLLHDIGILAIDQFLHDAFMEVLNTSLQKNTGYIQTEQIVLGVHHGDIGAFLGLKWGIPVFLTDTMKLHHSPLVISEGAPESKDKITVVHVADVVSTELGFGKFINNFNPVYESIVLQNLSIPPSALHDIGEQVRQETTSLIKEWGL
jgi:HD-like signal output (HDOD) protein